MSKEFGQSDPKIAAYVEKLFQPEDDVLKEVRRRSKENGLPDIQVGVMDGLHLHVLARANGAKKIVEIGTLGGYSGICLARALPEDGLLYTFELNEQNAKTARESFKKAKLDHKVRLFLGPALQNLRQIENEGPFDLVFVDADKAGYPDYFKWAAQNLRIGGVLLGDNTFAWGQIADKAQTGSEEEKFLTPLQKFNELAATQGQFKATILPTAEGLTFAVKIK